MLKCIFGTLGLLAGGLAGAVATFFGAGGLVEGGVIGMIVGVFVGWRLDKRQNRDHRTWKSILSTLGWSLGGLAGVVAVRAFERAWYLSNQTRFVEGDPVDGFFMQFSVAIVVLGLLGAFMGVIVGAFVGWRLDKRQSAGDRDHHRRHRMAEVYVVGGAAIVGLALGAYCYGFVARSVAVHGPWP